MPCSPLGSCVLLPKTAGASSTTPPVGREHLALLIASGDSEDKRQQPHHFHITNDSLHFKGLLPTLAPVFLSQQGHYALCCRVAQLAFVIIVSANLFYHCCREEHAGVSGAVVSLWVAGGEPRAVGILLLCCVQAPFRGLLGIPSNRDELNMASVPSQNTAVLLPLMTARCWLRQMSWHHFYLSHGDQKN